MTFFMELSSLDIVKDNIRIDIFKAIFIFTHPTLAPIHMRLKIPRTINKRSLCHKLNNNTVVSSMPDSTMKFLLCFKTVNISENKGN